MKFKDCPDRSPAILHDRRGIDAVELDWKEKRFLLRGDCLDLLPVCAAVCCRLPWVLNLSREEYESGFYDGIQSCSLTQKACEMKAVTCINRFYHLRKGPEGICIYLNAANRCSIYHKRPKVCRDFTCRGGWRINSVYPARSTNKTTVSLPDKKTFMQRLKGDMVFVAHPLIKLHAVIYVKARRRVIFIKEMVGGCGKFSSHDKFYHSRLNEELLLNLIHMFITKDTLRVIHQRFCTEHGVSLRKTEFHEIVWLLNKHNIVLSTMNFRGMLAGRGAI